MKEQFEKSTSQKLQGLFLPDALDLQGVDILLALVNSLDSFGQTLPAIVVLSIFGNNLKTFEDVDNVINPPFFDIEGFGDLVEFEEFNIPAFELI